MNILMSGGSGLIGKALVTRLLRDCHNIWILTRNPEMTGFQEPIQTVKWDGHSTFGWSHLVNDMHAIINLAGENLGGKRWSNKQKALLRDSRIYATTAIINAIKKAETKPGVLIQASAVGIYGTQSGDTLLDENSPGGDDFLANICLEWEETSRVDDEPGLRWIILRTGIVFSADGGALERVILPIKFFVGGPLGSGQQWWSWIHIHDLVEAITYLLNHQSAAGAYNMTAPNPEKMNTVGKTAAGIMHRPYLLPVPSFALQLLLGEMSTMVLDGQRVYPRRLIEAGYKYKFPELSDALNNILSSK